MTNSISQEEEKNIKKAYQEQLKIQENLRDIGYNIQKIERKFKETKSNAQEGDPEDLLKNI